MKLHQVLTGACNAGDRCFAVGSVEGIPFVTYAAGSNIVVLSVTFERVQIIPGICHQNVQISCIDCSTDTGKIAAAYGNKVKIFEPTPLVHHNSSHKLDYHWVETGHIQTEYFVRAISWNLEGTRLLLGGRLLQLWASKGTKESQEDIYSKSLPRSATFQLGAGNDVDSDEEDREAEAKESTSNQSPHTGDASDSYELAWETRTATPVRLMSFSPDGTLFATAGMNDPLVKVWYQDKPLLFPSKSMEHLAASSPTCMDNSTKYAFEYLGHPASVVSVEWRRTSKYMPRGSVANMLVTSCEDSICRVWVETVLPEDGLVNMNNFDPLAAQNPRFRTHRHKHKFMQRLKHMRHCFQLKRLLKQENGGKSPKKGNKAMTIPTLFSSYSVHDYHSYGIHGTGQANGLHFHLAATINAQTDIPLVPSLGGTASDKGFVVHWLNNKEMHFTLQAEYILQELSKKAVGREESFQNGVGVVESEDDRGEDPEPETDFLKRKKLRATTGDLAKFLRTEQDNGRNADLPSPHMLHPDQMMSNTASLYSMNTDITGVTGFGVPLGDALDHRIETLLKDWHHSPDLLYAVHPLDGSYLVWLVDWLDEYNPGSFRQAQVSFSSRLPNAVPLGDASTLSTHLALFNPFHVLDLRNLLHLEGPHSLQSPQPLASTNAPDDDADEETQSVNHASSSSGPAQQSAAGPSVASEEKHETNPFHASSSPIVAMVTKHANGTLNLWHLALSDQSKFTQVLSVSHMTRISGHRFRVNSISCHPVLPLLLTTSHHNVINNPNDREVFACTAQKHRRASGQANQGYCSELILWKVETVGPLGKSGGVKELARINSPEMSAFASVAWIPTVLPSSSLGGFSNSASACFVASDGLSLRIYQAVIDARTLLAQILITPTLGPNNPFNTSFDKESPARQFMLGNRTPVRIVSEQSTSRPGCILELDAMVEADHDWKQTQFLHVFQQQLLTGYKLTNNIATPSNVPAADSTHQTVPEVVPTSQRKMPLSQMPLTSRLSLMEVTQSAVVDLQESLAFSEPFYVVVVEKEIESEQKLNESLDLLEVPSYAEHNDGSEGTTVVHVWKLVISSCNEDQIGSASPHQKRPPGPNVTMKTIKMCTQRLPLPDGVGIIHAAPAAGHLSSASIYPACFAPYAMVTACTDNTVRFWRCKLVTENKSKDLTEEYLRWEEWQMISKEGTSLLSIPGRPLSVSVAYSGRIAVAYKNGRSFKGKFIRNSKKSEADTRYFDLVVSIYECESTGGSEWVQEDVIYLKNIRLPRLPAIDPNIDLAYLHEEGDQWLKKRQVGIETLTKNLSHSDLESQDNDGGCFERIQPKIQGLLSVPSYATILTLKKSIEHRGNVCPLTQKNLVQLDWVSKEDGSHILTVGVGHRVLLYTSVSSPAVKERFNNSKIVKNPKLARQTSQTSTFNQDDVTVRWLRLRSLELRTADGLPPLPMHLSWVRDGIFVVGMDNEMQIYSQWKDTLSGITTESNGLTATSPVCHHENLGEESGTDLESDTDGSVGYDDDVGEDRDVLDRELHTLAKEGRITYAPSMAQLPRASSMHALAAAQGSSHTKKVTIKTPKKKLDEKAQTVASPTVSLLQDCLPSYGLFEASQIACPVLPQYHPQQLMELLNSGKIRWVKAILAHLVRCIAGHRGTDSDDEDDEDVDESAKHWARTRTLSISSPDNESRKITADLHISSVPKELTLDYTEISAVPPLPLWLLLAADQGSANLGDSTASGADSLFQPSLETHAEEEEDLDTILSESPPKRKSKRKNANGDAGAQHLQQQYFQFGTRQAALLTSVLTHTQLPGLSSVDQMHLLALADTLASCSATHLVTSTIHSGASKNLAKSVPTHPGSESSLDSCGLRFLLAARHHSYLLRFLPPVQRAALKKQGISSSLLTWAFHSEAQDELLQLLPAFTKPNPMWADYRELGFGWWMRNNASLRRCIEKLAKAAYQSQGDPLDAAIYYLAMKKKNLVWGLFRQVQNERMTAFFSNNFTEERWRKAALKNAYALLGKQRFDHAVAFFLLAGSLKDAIDICLSRMQDIQLAIVITRLYEGDMESVPPGLKKLLQDHVLGYNESSEPVAASAGSDPFLRSMSYWLLAQYTDSLSTLLERRGDKGELTKSQNIASPSVFNFYIYLRNHPLIIRQQLALSATGQSTNKRTHLAGVGAISVDKTYLLQEWITPLERRLYFTTAHAHFLAGCPALALEVLSKLPDHVQQPESETDKNSEGGEENAPEVIQQVIQQKSEDMDWSTPLVIVSPSDETREFDWGQPINGKSDTLELKWSDDEASDSECSDGGITMRDMSVAEVAVTPSDPKLEAEPETGGLDIMAQQLKFIACLKILMGEMATLATGFEVDGGQLRLQLYLWLDRELQALQQLCNYAPIPVTGNGNEEDEPSLLPAIPSSYKHPISADEPVTLHEILLAEKLDLEAKVKRTNRRRRWLKANELLVRTLLSYCSVHGSQGGGLASVRMELILLLQELQQDRRFTTGGSESVANLNQSQLSSPLAYPTSLPLLAASVAGTEIITTDPVRHLESQIRDLLRAIIGLSCVPVPGKISFGQMCLIRDLALALSACLYQALCSSDAWSLQQQQQEQQQGSVGPLARLAVVFRAMHNIGVSNYAKREEPQLEPGSSPSKWPGVTSLRALLAREKDEDAPRLLTLLCEAFVAVYTSLLCYSMAACDSHVLYRLAGLQPTESMWGSIYGGGAKQLVRVTTTTTSTLPGSQGLGTSSDGGSPQPPGSPSSTMDVAKQRVRLHIKLLQQIGTPAAVGGGMTAVASSASISSSASRKSSLPQGNEDMPTYKEVFVAPKLSLVACLMKKPTLPSERVSYDYDSSASDAGDEVDAEDDGDNESDNDDFWEEKDCAKRAASKKAGANPGDSEHSKADSISWHAIRYAVTRLCIGQMEEFLRVAGVEPTDLPVVSPLSHAITRTMHQWCAWLQRQLDAAGPVPPNYIPGCVVENTTSGPPILKYRSLVDPNNTPFSTKEANARPIRRLWSFLVRQEKVQDIFIRLVFGKRHAPHASGTNNADSISLYSDIADEMSNDTITAVSGGGTERLQDPVRIIHKDQDIISAFCINSTNGGILALANGKEIQELDITPLLDMQSAVLEDECELDLLGLDRDPDSNASSFLVVQTPGDRHLLNQLNGGMSGSASTAHFPSYAPSASNSMVPPGGPTLPVTGRGTTLPKGLTFPGSQHPPFFQLVLRRSKLLLTPLRKHKVDGVRRMTAHPLLPLYIAGQGDGSVAIWEWGHVGVVCQPRSPGTYAKVNRLRFNSQGNKFGAADGDGHVALWTLRLGGGSAPHRPFFSHQCHSKGTSDFVFLGSSSILATTGHSSESRNVVLWDTLMPQRKAIIHSFVCHENGGTSLLYASQHQLLISAGRKGIVCLWDLRQRTLRHKFTAHDSSVAIKCMALDPNEEFFATGSADGDIKVWSLATQHLLYAFPAEHSRSSFFRSMGQGNGVNQIHLDTSGRLFSCGSDGSMKLRQLPYVGSRETAVSTLY
ncbi:dmX-like protein 2 isoform X2 [Daphnia pulex]|uniref:dmX-like protein 2 isoform X2 n=1 Tax=Daphnia pulex TaxID=6669 RepID=UPI001EDFE882|nr:dmX-like protein 2 isoform X2 [Daphnia pulex]